MGFGQDLSHTITQLSKMIWFDPFSVRRAMTQNIASPYALEIISYPAYISERGVSFYTGRRALTAQPVSLRRARESDVPSISQGMIFFFPRFGWGKEVFGSLWIPL